MTARGELTKTFIATTQWKHADRIPLAGDASGRRYERLVVSGLPNAVLMDASPDLGEDVSPFIKIAKHLTSIGLSAPSILAEDRDNGFLLIEDLGDAVFARVVEENPSLEESLYQEAANALIVTQSASPPTDLPVLDAAAMTSATDLLPNWYIRYGSEAELSNFERREFETIVSECLDDALGSEAVLVQRDFHAENLIWLPERSGAARVGLLDFQDAVLGHPSYDLASLLRDARRDVSRRTQTKTMEYFIKETAADPVAFKAAFAACSAQRNIRILGIFARLCVRDGKTGYPDLMPRVWKNLLRDLEHPALSKLARWVADHVPPVNPTVIARIKAAAHG